LTLKNKRKGEERGERREEGGEGQKINHSRNLAYESQFFFPYKVA